MRIHILSANRLAEDLAAGRVSAREQAVYIALGFCAWNLVYYLNVVPPRLSEGDFFWWLQMVEGALVILLNLTGVMFCLRKCRNDPRRDFAIFFSCLYLPVSVSTVIVVWGAFHLLTDGLWALSRHGYYPGWLPSYPWLSSLRGFDVLSFLAYVATIFVIFLRIGGSMERISNLQQSANHGLQNDAAPVPRA